MTDLDRLLVPDRLGPVLARATGDRRWRGFDAQLIAGGKSNLTFELSSPAGQLILRRPPEGDLLPSAHDMSREVRVQHALAATNVPVAGIVHAEEAADTLAVPFYLMVAMMSRNSGSRPPTAGFARVTPSHASYPCRAGSPLSGGRAA